MQPGSLRYNLPTNDFSINPTGTDDGWTPLYLSSDAENLTKIDLESWAEKLGGQNQSKLYVDNSSPLASDSKNNRGNSKLRPFKTIERALAEAARVSFKKNPLNSSIQNDIYERISINVAPGEYNVQNGPRSELNIFSYYDDYLNASYLISINKESAVETLSLTDNNLKLDIEYFVNSLIKDLKSGGNEYSLKFAKSLITLDSNIIVEDSNSPPQNYFISRYSDANLRTSFNAILTTDLKNNLYNAIENNGEETDFSINIVGAPLDDIKEEIETLINIVSDTLICAIDPRDPLLTNFGRYNITSFPIEEPTPADLQRFNSLNKTGIILPRGVSIVGDDLRKVIIRPTYVPDPGNNLEGRGAIFRMTGGNFFSGFTIKDHTEFKESHHKLSAFEFCTKVDLEDYYTQINTAFSDGSIYSRALFSSRIIEENEDWIEQQTILNTNYIQGLTYSLIFETEIHSLLVSIQKDLKALTNKNVFSWGSRFYNEHILSISSNIERQEAVFYYKSQIDTVYFYIIKSIINSGKYVDLDNIESRIEEFTLNGITFEGRNADIQAAIFIYIAIIKDLIEGLPPIQTEFSTNYSDDDIEVINEEVSIVLGLTTPIEDSIFSPEQLNSVRGCSPYIFSASLRSQFGLCGIDGDGDEVNGLRSYLAAQFTIISLQNDPNAFIIDVNEVGGKKYKEDWKHFGYKVNNRAYSQLVSCFCIGPAIHYIAEGGAEFSITNSTSNFGDISLYSQGFIDNKNGGGAYPQDQGFNLVGIRKPKPLPSTPEDAEAFYIGYLKENGTTLTDSNNDLGTGTITLTSEVRNYGYTLIGSIIRIDNSVSQLETKARINNINTNLTTGETVLDVQYLTQYSTTWNNNAGNNFVFGITGKPIYIRRFVDRREEKDKFYYFLIEKPDSSEDIKREPITNYILRKGGVLDEASQPFKNEKDKLFYISRLLNTETESNYECLFSSGYSNDDKKIRYYDDIVEDSILGEILDIDPEDAPDFNSYSLSNNLLHKEDLYKILVLYLGQSGANALLPSLDLTPNRDLLFANTLLAEFNKPSVIRCSGHTWEYVGYLNYDSSIPQFQTKNINDNKIKLLKAQTELAAGKIYATGMDEEGNQYIGNRILDLKTGEETLVGRGDSDPFEQQNITVFKNLTVLEQLTSRGNLDAEKIKVETTIEAETATITEGLEAKEIEVTESLTVIENINCNNNLNVTEDISAKNIEISGDVAGNTASITGLLDAGTLQVIGDITSLNGNISANNVSVGNQLILSGAVGRQIVIDENTSFSGSFDTSSQIYSTSTKPGLIQISKQEDFEVSIKNDVAATPLQIKTYLNQKFTKRTTFGTVNIAVPSSIVPVRIPCPVKGRIVRLMGAGNERGSLNLEIVIGKTRNGSYSLDYPFHSAGQFIQINEVVDANGIPNPSAYTTIGVTNTNAAEFEDSDMIQLNFHELNGIPVSDCREFHASLVIEIDDDYDFI
jgi:hypothetical protein